MKQTTSPVKGQKDKKVVKKKTTTTKTKTIANRKAPANKARLSKKHKVLSLVGVFVFALSILLGALMTSQRENHVLAYSGFLRRQGTNIVDGNGKRVMLNGFNMGNWFLWEQWMMGTPMNETGQTVMRQNLTSVIGEERMKQFEADVYNNYYTAADFQQIANQGFNVVRLPINYRLLEEDSAPGLYKESGWQLIDNAVSWAEQAGIYIVLDLHSAPGGQSPHFPSAPPASNAQTWNSTSLWATPSAQNRTVALWQAIADRYKSSTTVAAYDLINEPTPASNTELTTLYQQIISAIRAVDPNHMVMLEGTDFDKNHSMFTTRYDENMAITFHQYMWGTLWADGDLNTAVSDAKRLDVPLWVGEFGLDHNHVIADRVKRYTNEAVISGYAGWAWKSSTQTGWNSYWRVPNTFTPTPTWQKVIAWMADTTRPKPTAAEAERGMQDYITLIKSPTVNQANIDAYKTPGARGLTGTYYNDLTFTNKKLVRYDSSVNYNWWLWSPDWSMPGDNFSVRWTGSIEPTASETYTFTTTADDKVRVWIGDQLIIDDWVSNGTHTKSGSFAMQAGQKYPIKIEYQELGWSAQVQLRWQSPSTPQAVVPTNQLSPF